MRAHGRVKPRISVIVATYNNPRSLEFIFCALAQQTLMPDEIIVADDGSCPATAEVIDAWRPRLDARVEHVWHVDRGFRKSRICNEAVRRSTGDHLVFLDGDTVPHHRFVEDHVVAARPNRISCGRRVKLSEALSAEVELDWVETRRLESLVGPILWSSIAQKTTRYFLAIRLPALAARIVRPRARRLMGVNFSLAREAFERVNGYDQEPGVHARIDRDLELRLRACGFQFYPLLQRAIAFHLYHPERPGIRDEKTRTWLAEKESSGHARCECGYDSPFDPDE